MGKSNHSDETRNTAIMLVLEEGVSQAEVANRLSVPPQTVNLWIKAYKAGRGKKEGTKITKKMASITFGAVIAEFRHQADYTGKSSSTSTEEFSRRIGIGGSSLRMLEAGSLPQITLAYPLATECGLSLPMTVLVIGFVRAVDNCDTTEKIREVAEEFGKQEPSLGFFVNHLIDATKIAITKRTEHLKEKKVLASVIELMRSTSRHRLAEISTADPILGELSPVLLDAVRVLSSKLQFFNPALDATSLNAWESANSHRIRRIWSYHVNPHNLLDTIDAFSWNFIDHKKPRPQYIVIFKEPSQDNAGTLRAALLEKFPNLEKDFIAVNEINLSKELDDEFSRALWFDLSSGKTCLCEHKVSPEAYNRSYNLERYLKMTTINFYEIQDKATQIDCAFVDDSEPSNQTSKNNHQPGLRYARALNQLDTENIFNLFRRAGEEMGLNL